MRCVSVSGSLVASLLIFACGSDETTSLDFDDTDDRVADCGDGAVSGILYGFVFGPREMPIGNATLSVTTSCGTQSTTTDDTGSYTFRIIYKEGESRAPLTIEHLGNQFDAGPAYVYEGDTSKHYIDLDFDSPCLEARYVYLACQQAEPADFMRACGEEPQSAKVITSMSCSALADNDEFESCTFDLGCGDLVCRPLYNTETSANTGQEYCLAPGGVMAGCAEDGDCEDGLSCVAGSCD